MYRQLPPYSKYSTTTTTRGQEEAKEGTVAKIFNIILNRVLLVFLCLVVNCILCHAKLVARRNDGTLTRLLLCYILPYIILGSFYVRCSTGKTIRLTIDVTTNTKILLLSVTIS